MFKNCKTVKDVKAVWRQLASKYHPDRPRGNDILFNKYHRQYKEALLYVSVCQKCQDTGITFQKTGFYTMEMPCSCGKPKKTNMYAFVGSLFTNS